jgi:hypothetical protein
MGAPENYYEAPDEGTALQITEKIELPGTFAEKLALALRLFSGNFFLLAAVVLTVWIPLNLAIETFAPHGKGLEEFVEFLRLFTDAIFSPIVTGSVIWIIDQRVSGCRVSYREAVGTGLRCWGPIFSARFVADIFILFGLLALILPGISLGVHYAFVEQAATLENPGIAASRHRSTEVVRGHGWEVFFLVVLNNVIQKLASAAESIAVLTLQDFGLSTSHAGTLAAKCALNMVGAFSPCLLTVFYLEYASRNARNGTLDML